MYWFTQFLPDDLRVPFTQLWDRDLPILQTDRGEFIKLVRQWWESENADQPRGENPHGRLEAIVGAMGYSSMNHVKIDMGVSWWEEKDKWDLPLKKLWRVDDRLEEMRGRIHAKRAKRAQGFVPGIWQVYRGDKAQLKRFVFGDDRNDRMMVTDLSLKHFGKVRDYSFEGLDHRVLAWMNVTHGLLQIADVEGVCYWFCRPFTQECRAYALELADMLVQAGIGGSTQVFDPLPLPDDPIDRAIVETLKDDPSMTDKELSAHLVGKIPGKPDGIGRQAVNIRRGKLAEKGYLVRPFKGDG